MKKNKKLLVILLGIVMLLIFNQNKASADTTNKINNFELGIENLVDYINNTNLSESEALSISDKSKSISEDIKENAKFRDYKLTEILRIYKNFTSISNSLNLNIDFSFKNGDFTLKDKLNGNSIFKGNVSEIKKYFQFIKNNTELLT